MIIDKIKNNKFKISFSSNDFEEELDLHSFMASNLKRNLFIEKVLKKINNIYNMDINLNDFLIDLFYIGNDNFIMIITKELEKETIKRVKVRRNLDSFDTTLNIYKFSNKEDFYDLLTFLKDSSNFIYKVLKNCHVYYHNNLYFLIINQNGISEHLYSSIDKYLSEFCFKVNNPKNFYIKLIEIATPCNTFL